MLKIPREQGRLANTPLCPKCRRELDAFSVFEAGSRPEPGDLTVCLYCSALLEFDSSMALITATAESIAGIADLTELQAATHFAHEFQQLRKKEQQLDQ